MFSGAVYPLKTYPPSRHPQAGCMSHTYMWQASVAHVALLYPLPMHAFVSRLRNRWRRSNARYVWSGAPHDGALPGKENPFAGRPAASGCSKSPMFHPRSFRCCLAASMLPKMSETMAYHGPAPTPASRPRSASGGLLVSSSGLPFRGRHSLLACRSTPHHASASEFLAKATPGLALPQAFLR